MRYFIIRIYRQGKAPRNTMIGVVEDAAGRQRPFHDTEELLDLLHSGDRAAAQDETAGVPDSVEKR